MKKEICLILILIMFSQIVLAITASEDITNISNAVRNAATEIVQEKVELPDSLRIPARVIFGINEETTLSEVIVLIGVWVMIFIIIFSAMNFFFFAHNFMIRFFVAFVIMLIISVTHAIKEIAVVYYSLFNIFSFMEKIPEWAKVGISLAILIIILVTILLFFRKAEKKSNIEAAEIAGRRISGLEKTARMINEE